MSKLSNFKQREDCMTYLFYYVKHQSQHGTVFENLLDFFVVVIFFCQLY